MITNKLMLTFAFCVSFACEIDPSHLTEAVVSTDRHGLQHITIIGEEDIKITVASAPYLGSKNYLLETLDKENMLVIGVIVGEIRCVLLGGLTDSVVKLYFNAQLRKFLLGVKDKLKEVRYGEHPAYSKAFKYLLYELANEPIPDEFKKYEKLAKRIRPDPEPELPSSEAASASLAL